MKLIKINALWCPSCLIMNKTYTEFAQKNNLTLKSLDYDFDEEVSKYQVGNTLPVLILLDDSDNEIVRVIGEKKLKELEELTKEYI